MRVLAALLALVILPAAVSGQCRAEEGPADGITISHAIAEFGEPKYGPDFEHFDYADPDAPKGGTLTLGTGAVGIFETLNIIPRAGVVARSVSLLHDSLMFEPQEEIGVMYGLIAETVEYPEDRSWAIFNLRPEARWHDGTPITADDVVWTFEKILEVGHPVFRQSLEALETVTALDPHRVRFDFKTTGTMNPMSVVAGFPIQPRHWWEAGGRDIGKGTLEPILGSGPYRIVQVDPGRSLVWERVEDYWAADLPVRRGFFNFDRIRYDYYRDADVLFEAFKGGAYGFRVEFSSRNWATGYDIPAVRDGRLIREEVQQVDYAGMQAFWFNTRREKFSDIRLRRAFNYLYPFEWVNETLMYGLRERSLSYFAGNEYASSGLPSEAELELLEPLRGRIPDAVFETPFTLPVNEGARVSRENLREALRLMAEAGWVVRDGRMVNAETGEPLTVEILLSSPTLEPHTAPLVQNLRQIGVDATVRVVDSAQFQERYQTNQYDMIVLHMPFPVPPGPELRAYYGSEGADMAGSLNMAGVSDPAVDALIEAVLDADTLEEQITAMHALDRVLLWGWYVVPQWHSTTAFLAYWDRFGFPDTPPARDIGLPNDMAFQPTWWVDPDKDAELIRRGRT